MKKPLAFGLSLLAVMAGSAGLRYWQRTAAFEPGTGLLTPGAASTWCLVGLLVIAAAAFVPLGRWALRDGTWRSYLASFALPHRVLLAVYLLAGAFLVGAGMVGVRQYQTGLNDQLSRYICSIALVPTGLDVALVGWLNAQRQEAQGRFAWPLLVPGWCGCVWLIAAYQAHTAQPNVMAYALYFLGAVCAVTGCYAMASFSFERPRPVWCLWLCAMALTLLATALVDAVMLKDSYKTLVCLGFMLYLAAQLKCLLRRAVKEAELEPWEAPAEQEEEVEQEAEDRE